MTNERAIELLHRISDSQFDGIHGDERREALSMAVRALEGDGDTISRKMVIDVIEMICDCVCAGMSRSGIVRPIEIDADILKKALDNTVNMLADTVVLEGSER